MNQNKVHMIAGLILLGAVVTVSGYVLWVGLGAFSGANPTTQAALLAGLVAVFSLIFTYWKERSRSLKEAHRDKKIEVYSKFYELMFGVLAGVNSGKRPSESDLAEAFFEISKGVLFYGAPPVVSALADFKRVHSTSDPIEAMRRAGRILLAMREDIGLSNRGLNELSVHQLFVKDDLRTLEASTK